MCMKYIYMSLILIVNVSIKIVHFSINVGGFVADDENMFPQIAISWVIVANVT